ncbi:MAG: glycosyltransferase family 9 protein [Acidobacteria bacterium]|nr:glycosyltransferase family 9 protein [Acidobacteriota bacterium]
MGSSNSFGSKARSLVRQALAGAVSPHSARAAGAPLYRLAGRAEKEKEIDVSRMRRVLVLRLDEIGDMVLMSAFLRELRRNLSADARVTLVVKPATFNLVEQCPYVNEVLTFDWAVRGRLASVRLHGRALRFAKQHLWKQRFDLAILPRWDADYYHASFLTYFSGAALRLAYSEKVNERKEHLNANYDRLFTHLIYHAAEIHEVEHNLEVLRFLGGTVQSERLEVWVTEEDHEFAEATLRKPELREADPLIAYGPSGGNSVLKQWPAQHFIALGRELRTEWNARFVILGGPGEAALGKEITEGIGREVACNLAGRTTLRQMAALLRRCRLFVGNDAGPMHIAAAAGTRVVALFGSSCTHRFRPWGDGHVVVTRELDCRPCAQPEHRDRCAQCIYERPLCLHDLSVGTVRDAVRAAMAQQSRPGVARKR